MGYPNSDKAGGGTPGQMWRQRLEYGIGTHSLERKRDILSSLHSHQRSMNPQDTGEKIAGEESISELLKKNDQRLLDSVEIFRFSAEGQVIAWADKKKFTLLFDQIIQTWDEITYRCKLYENIKPASAPGLNQLG